MNESSDDSPSRPLSTEDHKPERKQTPVTVPVAALKSGKTRRYSNVAIFAAGAIAAVALLAIAQALSLHWFQILEICLSLGAAGTAVKICWSNCLRSLISLALVGMIAISRAFAAESVPMPGNSVLVVIYWIVAILAGLTFLGRLAERGEQPAESKHTVPSFLLLLLAVFGIASQFQSERRKAALVENQRNLLKTSNQAEANRHYWNDVVLPYLRILQSPQPDDKIDEWLDQRTQRHVCKYLPTVGNVTTKVDQELITEFARLLRANSTITSCARRRQSQRRGQAADTSIEGQWLMEHQSFQSLLDSPIEKTPGYLCDLRAAIIEQDDALVRMYNVHIRLSERYSGTGFSWPEATSNAQN